MICRLILIAALLAPAAVLAQPLPDDPTTAILTDESPDGTAAPWANASPEDRDAARALFAEGNQLLRDAMFTRAIDAYRRALARWDHPAIHYELALALINVDDPAGVYDALVKATAYGPAALAGERFARAREVQTLVAAQIGTLELTLTDETRVTVDGVEVLRGPGHWTGRVRAGKHTVVQAGGSILPLTRTVFVGGGETLRLDAQPDPRPAGPCRRPTARWPYVAIGAGAAVIVATGVFHRSLGTTDVVYGYTAGALAITAGAARIAFGHAPPDDCNPALSSSPELSSASDPAFAVAPMLDHDLAGIAAAVRF